MDVSCPQCGNPQLDVDAENSVVYCKNCGFAVKVDPQTGQATPISNGSGGGAPMGGGMPAAGASYGGPSLILGTEPLTFFMGGTVIALLLVLLNITDLTIAGVLWAIVAYIYFTHH
jgi:hypothetical protein